MILDTATYHIIYTNRYSNCYVTMLLTQQPNILLTTNWISNLYVTILLIQQPISLLYMNQGDRPPAAREPPLMRIPGAARRTPRHNPRLSKTMNFVLLYCGFSLFCHLCYSISAYPKTHKPRGRASDVSTISTCFLLCYDILPTPPPISVRAAGVPLLCTCTAFSSLCYVKRIYSKKIVLL